jgi:hypothetical protein
MVSSQSLVIPDNTLVRTALTLAEQGLPCFPCLDSKSPACPGGFKAATKNLSQLEGLWKKYPGNLIGVPTGNISGFDVLDIDPRHGGDKWLNENSEFITPTRVHETRSGGKHFLFSHQPGLRNSANKIASGVDVRADGGYIIWWPALGFLVHQWGLLAPWPPWLLLSGSNHKQYEKEAAPNYNLNSSLVLRKAVKRVASAPSGCRNDTLNKEAFSLLRFIETGDIDPLSVCAALAEAALASGLSQNEVLATLASALRGRGIK